MRVGLNILCFICLFALPVQQVSAQKGNAATLHFDFFGVKVELPFDNSLSIAYDVTPSPGTVTSFYKRMDAGNHTPLVEALLSYKQQYGLNDWLYYQLIRKTAQQIAPKADNYRRYTLYKWFLLSKSGYDAKLALSSHRLIFFVRSDEEVFDIPFYRAQGKQYVCINIHDYANVRIDMNEVVPIDISVPEAQNAFSYKVTQMPDFTPADYSEKEMAFSYNDKIYHFKLKVNPQVQQIFKNYPVVDYESYFNIPLSRETYNSLIPALKQTVAGMKQKQGVDFLMRFTRNAFLYEPDEKSYGKEKRLSPEQTLLYQYSDCDDRAALFFYLVKEVYNLPMIAVLYATHVTVAVKFDKPTVGGVINYKGEKYTVCEPTPQAEDLGVGQLSADLRNATYTVAYEYRPHN